MVFGRNIDGTVHTAKFNGTDFDTPVQITPNNFQCYLANWTGPEIDASGDTIMIVFKENHCKKAMYIAFDPLMAA